MRGITHLEKIKFVQENWVIPAKVEERCILPTTTNNVSCTVIVDNYEEVAKYVFEHQDIFTAVSFLSEFGDKDYPQAPFTSVLNSEELLEKYGDAVIFASGLIVDGLHYFDQNLWDACEHIMSKEKKVDGTRTEVLLKKDWIRRAKQFAKNYFKSDITKMIYCLKDVHLWYKWNKINKSFKEVDFEKILTKPTYNDASDYGAVACSGNSCEITKI
jgi:ribonucleoside-diphosphate reductase alpha chain